MRFSFQRDRETQGWFGHRGLAYIVCFSVSVAFVFLCFCFQFLCVCSALFFSLFLYLFIYFVVAGEIRDVLTTLWDNNIGSL